MSFYVIDKKSGTYDGHYAVRSDAERMAGFMNAKWNGAGFAVVETEDPENEPSSHGIDWHGDDEGKASLLAAYGPEDFSAADKFDRDSRNAY